ncbi:protein kinase domain-containing protein [Nonomuraea cavernae]|uniref:protein kinase domain-containing protein n=1 Tax=Nonomuraea cavernae TaxID=2045107 RepID=UPI00340D088C
MQPLRPGDPTALGPYMLLGFLGEGGQGAVFAGRAPDGTAIAAKVLHARFAGDTAAVQRFQREVELARRVAQFCTARVLDVGFAGAVPYIVSELVEGVSLQQAVRTRGPLTGDDLVRLAVGTMTALISIHRAGIVHRDFKPSNVLLAADGPRVIDFGIARALDASSVTASSVVGSPGYMSPEQIRGERIGSASDLFSWAGTMVYAATGSPAFGLDSIPAVMHRVLNIEPDLRAIGEPLHDVLTACLQKDPALRPDAQTAWNALMDGSPAAVPVTPPRDSVPGGNSRRDNGPAEARRDTTPASPRRDHAARRTSTWGRPAVAVVAAAVTVSAAYILWPAPLTSPPAVADPAVTTTLGQPASATPAPVTPTSATPTGTTPPASARKATPSTSPTPSSATTPTPTPTTTPTRRPAVSGRWDTKGDVSEWDITGPRSAKLIRYPEGPTGPGWGFLMWTKRPMSTSFTLSVRARLLEYGRRDETPKYGLLFSNTEPGNDIGYYVEPLTAEGKLTVLVMEKGAFSAERIPWPFGFDPDDFHTLKVTRKGSTYTFHVDGRQVSQREVPGVDPQGLGRVGLAGFDVLAAFRDFRMQK